MSRRRLSFLPLAVSALALAVAAPAHAAPPPIKHVFVIVLENKDYEESFGKDPKSPYLGRDLVAQGQLLTQYHATGHLSLDNYIAMISGQAPNPVTQSDCQVFQEFFPGTIGEDGQAGGAGCVYPSTVKTLADQLVAKGLDWGGYMEDMGNSTTEAQVCRHPPINGRDTTQSAKATDQYAPRGTTRSSTSTRSSTARTVQTRTCPLDRSAGDPAHRPRPGVRVHHPRPVQRRP